MYEKLDMYWYIVQARAPRYIMYARWSPVVPKQKNWKLAPISPKSLCIWELFKKM